VWVVGFGVCVGWGGGGPDGELEGLNASHVWRWRIEDGCLVVGSRVTLVLDTSCCTGTFVYCTRGSLYNRSPVRRYSTVVMGSTCGTNTVL